MSRTSPAPTRPRRLTSRVFLDLALWMAGFGVVVGVVFPFAIIPLGVPADLTMHPSFFAATVLAGLLVGAANYALARRVVGTRLGLLSRRMRHVRDVVTEATYTGDWTACSPDDCHLPVDSHDEIGAASAAFNALVDALATSQEVEAGQAAFTRALAHHLDLDTLSDTALTGLQRAAGADAGAVCVVRDGELEVLSRRRLRTEALCTGDVLASVAAQDHAVLLDVPDTVLVDAAVVAFRPRAVLLVPLRCNGVTVGMAVLAFAAAPSPEVTRLVGNLAGPTAVALQNALTHEQFQRLAVVDGLTGAYNRRFGTQRLAEEWSRAVRAAAPLGMLTFDLDHFKAVNDTYGHLAGDRVLRDVVAAARFVLREGDVLVRSGGEEFLVLLPGAGATDLADIGERLRRTVADMVVPVRGSRQRVTVSVGGASAPDCGAVTAEQLHDEADRALYSAKEAGRDRVVLAPGHQGTLSPTP